MKDDETTLGAEAGQCAQRVPGGDPNPHPFFPPLSIAPAPDGESSSAPPAPSAGGFVLLRPYETGGLGLVGIARDVALDREVAFKQIRPELADDPGSRRRFVHEAKITGQLEHPGIVPVHALGCDADGRPYYAMKFVRGRTLRQAIAEYHEAPSAPALRDLLRRFVSVCQAIAYAHSKGVVHRDLKPANIMLGDYGETLILDWGLAKSLVGAPAAGASPAAEFESLDALFLERGVTSAGQIVGTPGYMPPEQAGSGPLGPPADVYSLGAVLYKLLCNRTPYQGGTTPEALRRGKLEPPVPPSHDCAGVPRSLEAICLRAMSVRPEERYDAAELAREVERWLADEPVSAWREPPLTRALRWARHHKPLVAAVAVLLVSLTIALAVNNVLVRHEQARTEAARGRAEQASARATAQARLARDSERQAKLQLARTLVYQGEALALAGRWEPARARYAEGGEQLAALGESRFPADIGLWNAYRAAPPPLYCCQVGSGPNTAMAFAPNGGTILIATRTGTLQLRDARTGAVVSPAFNRPDPLNDDLPSAARLAGINCVAFSADGRLAVSGSDDATLTLWDTTTGTPRRTFRGHRGRVTAVAFCGRQILSGSSDETLKLWDPDRPDPVCEFRGHTAGVTALACSADGRVAVSGGSEPEENLRAWDIPGRRCIRTLIGHEDNVHAVGLSPDGLLAVSGSADGTVRCWDLETGQQTQMFAEPGHTFSAVALSPDKQSVLCGTLDGTLGLWSVERGRQVATFAGHEADITSVAFSADGRLAASGAADGSLYIWDASAGREAGTQNFRGSDALLTCVAFSHDGLTALSGGYDRIVRTWDIATGLPLATFAGHGHTVTCVVFAPDGRTAASAGEDGTVLLWDLTRKAPARRLGAGKAAVNALAFFPDSASLVTGGNDGAINLWDVRPANPLNLGQLGPRAAAVNCLAFTPDGRSILSGGADGTLRIWPTAPPPASQPPPAGRTLGQQSSALTCLAVSPDGHTVVSGGRGDKTGRGGTLMLWNLAAAGPPRTLAAPREMVISVGFTADGRLALSRGLDETVMLWDMHRDGQPFGGTVGPGEYFESAAFSPDCQRLISGGYDKGLRLWNFETPSLYEHLRPRVEAALNRLQTAPEDAPPDPSALLALGEWYAFRGRPDWAVYFFARAASAGADPPALPWARCAWLNGDTAFASSKMKLARSRAEAPQSYLNKCLDAIESAWEPLPSSRNAAGQNR